MTVQHPCKGKCSDFKSEQCKSCLITDSLSTAENSIDVLALGGSQASFDQVFQPEECNVQM